MLALARCFHKDELLNVAIVEGENNMEITEKAFDLLDKTQEIAEIESRGVCMINRIREDVTIKDRETLEEIAFNHCGKETMEFFVRDYCEAD